MPRLFVEMGLFNFFARLTTNPDPPDFYLPSSWDHKSEKLCPAPSQQMFIKSLVCDTHCSVYCSTYNETKPLLYVVCILMGDTDNK
jgi:hypothetical protein